MFTKIIIIALLSLILTGCTNNTARNNTNDYARLSNDVNYPYSSNPPATYNLGTGPTTTGNETSGENYVDEIKKEIYGSKEDLNIKPENCQSYTTPILTTDPNRYHNITIVCDRLDGYVLKNNETFSFNDVCGPYGKDDGFKEATILLSNGEKDKGYGGGVCQLSSTLYNAVKNLDIDIVERHHHSVPVAYVPKDDDATVSLQSNLDFKFKNVSGKNLRFETNSTTDSLTVTVYEE